MNKESIISIFITIITIVDPLGLLPVYIPLVEGISYAKKKMIIIRSFFYALIISTLFLLLGRPLFYYLGIDFSAVYVVGGILLFKVGIDMIFSKPNRKEENNHLAESDIYKAHNNLAIYPLAIPLLSGPGTIAAIIMLSSKDSSIVNYSLIFAAFTFAYALACFTMLFSEKIVRRVGPTGLSIAEKVMGIILCSLAVQFLINALAKILASLPLKDF